MTKTEPTRTLTLTGALILISCVATAQTRWTPYTSPDYGIRLSIPDAERCATEESAGVGELHCDYGDMELHVYAIEGHRPTAELRELAAREASEVPRSAWRFTAASLIDNGYSWAESWEAAHGSQHVVGMIGHSARRPMSHVAFITGDDAAWRRHQREVRAFVEHVHAL